MFGTLHPAYIFIVIESGEKLVILKKNSFFLLRWGSALPNSACRNEKISVYGPTRNVFGLGLYIFLCISRTVHETLPQPVTYFFALFWA